MIFADRFCGEARRRLCAAGAQKSLLEDSPAEIDVPFPAAQTKKFYTSFEYSSTFLIFSSLAFVVHLLSI